MDLLPGIVAAIDGEKDPRCLLLSFQLTQQVLQICEEMAPEVGFFGHISLHFPCVVIFESPLLNFWLGICIIAQVSL